MGFVMQSSYMNPNWAEENLQTIRTIMERSALYRRALAPIMLFAGILGIVAAGIGVCCHLDSVQSFCGLWLGTAVIVLTGAFFNTRRQAIKDKEALWSPPTRRVAQALLPPLFIGLFIGVLVLLTDGPPDILPFIWALFYGCALHSAGFFISRGVRWFGWMHIILALAGFLFFTEHDSLDLNPHWFMGFFFGFLHFAYGVYLYLTEKRKNVA
jgi:hypothetical protein